MDDQFRRSHRLIDAEEQQEMAETLNDLQTLGTTPAPRIEFSRSLREQLMNASTNASFGTPSVISSRSDRPRALPSAPRSQHKSLSGWLVSAAMVAALLIGAFYFSTRHGEPGNTGSRVPAASFAASPETGGAVDTACNSTEPYLACGQLARLMGGGLVFDPSFDTAALDGKKVQLQGWRLEPGVSVPSEESVAEATGVVVDVVLSGAYTATFDVPVKVTRGALTIRAKVEYHERGKKIELGFGDTVSYRLGGLTELSNPLSRLELEFKRVVIYEGDITSISGASAEVKTVIDGEAMLDLDQGELTSAPGREVSVSLWYAQLEEGSPFPPISWTDATSIGPVDPQDGPAETEGFFLVIRPAQE